MDMIQQILLVLKVLITRFSELFTFVNNQFLPPPGNTNNDSGIIFFK